MNRRVTRATAAIAAVVIGLASVMRAADLVMPQYSG